MIENHIHRAENLALSHLDYVLWALAAIWGLGLILGMLKQIVVYRDFNDVTFCWLTVTLPIAAFFILMNMGATSFYGLASYIGWLEATMALVILVRTSIDNRNPFKAVLAFMVKIPVAILLAVNIVDFATGDKRQSRRMSAFFILLLSGFVIALVDDRSKGFLATGLLRRHGISQRGSTT
ncbi:hypothetical protein [Salinisphaera hydrothermalis]|uniref:Uncharacterized protein n=1 Tax=Salinisphaera hydrothermalis (strain C41B8) TaxID=1304275 RepID=A0A084IIN5_SALHC|nr:hypothetical protein [Salinisphaera hydrothermalis]KEZ76569.1 hypothetical protein C41B8_14175 [Salinisphaera hydrothermalis C41B8]